MKLEAKQETNYPYVIGFRMKLDQDIAQNLVVKSREQESNQNNFYNGTTVITNIYGLVEPLQGRNFFYEFSHFNSNCFGAFLEKFTQKYEREIHIIQLDNAPVHTAKKLIVPDNVILLFQPPYCPVSVAPPLAALNPIERVWLYIKQKLKNLFFTSLDDVKDKVAFILNSLSKDIVHSLTGWQYILDALSLQLLLRIGISSQLVITVFYLTRAMCQKHRAVAIAVPKIA